MQNNLTYKDIETLNKFAEEYDIEELKVKDRKKIFNIKKLYILNLEIEYIPTEVFKLTNLKKLIIGDRPLTYLKKLPKEIGNLVNLEEFEVYIDNIDFPGVNCTGLKKLPDEIYNLTKLKNSY